MSKVRVSTLAKELGIPSKDAVTWLNANGEYVKSAASTIEAPVERKLREAFPAKPAAPKATGGATPGRPAPKPAAAEASTEAPAAPSTPAVTATPAGPAPART